MRYKILVEYDGTNYHGWQAQKNFLSIQQCLSDSLKPLANSKHVEIFGCGRTDAGVHAMCQCAHFDIFYEDEQYIEIPNNEINLKDRPPVILKNRPSVHQIKNCMNRFLPRDIIVLSVEQVDDNFHARFSAKKRSYMYLICKRQNALMQNRAWVIRQSLNVDLMNEAALLLIGKHDFSSFRAVGCKNTSPERTVNEAYFVNKNAGINSDFIDHYFSDNYIAFYISAKSFLYHQVRNIVGTLVDVGLEQISVNDFYEIFMAKDRKRAGQTAPACGLYFVGVEY